MTEPASQIDPDEEQSSARKRVKPPRTVGYEICRICGVPQKRLTVTHLRTHGFDWERYQRVYACAVRPAAAPRAEDASGEHPTPATPAGAANLAPAMLDTVTEELLRDEGFVTRLANEVGNAIFAGPVRTQLRIAIASLLHTRIAMHGKSVALLEEVRKELSQPWRIKADGVAGSPTKTSTLTSMLQSAVADVKVGEDMLLKTVKMAIDEAKSTEPESAFGGELDRYTGEAERIPVPEGLTPSEREGVRSLIGMLKHSVDRRRAVDGEVVRKDEGTQADTLEADQPTPSGAHDDDDSLSSSSSDEEAILDF